jgi:hypothetical protein
MRLGLAAVGSSGRESGWVRSRVVCRHFLGQEDGYGPTLVQMTPARRDRDSPVLSELPC